MAITIMCSNSKAQTTKTTSNNSNFDSRVSLAFKVGTNYSNVYDSKDETFHADPKFGFLAGGYVAIPLGKYFGVQPEVLFSQKGYKATGTLLGTTYSMTRTTSFIDVPILFAVKPSEHLTLVVGPQYSFLLQRKDEYTNGTTTVLQQQEFNNENYRKNIFSAMVGVDATMQNLVLGLRAAWDLEENNGDGTSTTPRYKNRWLQASLAFRF